MSVLRSQRRIAKTEYENTFYTLYHLTRKQLEGVPHRRHKWLCPNIINKLNAAYSDIMLMTDYYAATDSEKNLYYTDASNTIISTLESLQKPMLVMWNIMSMSMTQMAQWVDLANMEVELLNKYTQRTYKKFYLLDNDAISKATFVQNMCDLHKYTHGKVSRAKSQYDDAQGALLLQGVDNALYYVCEAQRIYPASAKTLKQRRDNLGKAIGNLRSMERPMLSYFYLMSYGDKTMTEWSNMLSYEIRLLTNVIRSDKERFSHLQ